MDTFTLIALACVALFFASLFFDDIDFGDALNFGHDGSTHVSLRTMLLFGVGFGAGGMIGARAGWGVGVSSLFGILLGVAVGMVGAVIGAAIMKQEGNTVANLNNLTGRKARVTVPMQAPGDVGQVAVANEFGHYGYHPARSSDRLAAGETVEVTGQIGDTLWVKRVVSPQGAENGSSPRVA